MTMILGVDPGMIRTGLALLEIRGHRPRLVWWGEAKGPVGTSNDFPRAVAGANRIADEVFKRFALSVTDAVVVESFTDQGGQRRARTRGSWLAPMVCQAIYDRFRAERQDGRIHWQPNEPALSMRKGTGQFVDAARFGRLAGGLLQPRGECIEGKYPGSLPEHAADAFGHALYFHDQGGRLGAMMR